MTIDKVGDLLVRIRRCSPAVALGMALLSAFAQSQETMNFPAACCGVLQRMIFPTVESLIPQGLKPMASDEIDIPALVRQSNQKGREMSLRYPDYIYKVRRVQNSHSFANPLPFALLHLRFLFKNLSVRIFVIKNAGTKYRFFAITL